MLIGWFLIVLGAAFAIYFAWWVIGCLRAWVFYPRPQRLMRVDGSVPLVVTFDVRRGKLRREQEGEQL